MGAALAVVEDVGVRPVLDALGLSRATFYRRRRSSSSPRSLPTPTRALSEAERAEVLEVLNSPEHVDSSPAEVHAQLLSQAFYLCSLRTMYRILAEAGGVRERRDRARHPRYQRPQLVATRPNQVWSWDITKLRTPYAFVYLYLYVILDLFSCYVVGWMIAEQQTAALAKRLIAESCEREGIRKGQLVLHADRGSQMIAQPTVQLCTKLGITRSHNRPRVSNDNPYSESQFATAKQHPGFPGKFDGLISALAWGREFFPWYNEEHHHSGLAYLTPAQVHRGSFEEVLVLRQQALDDAYARKPERFVKGRPRVARPPQAVWINRPKCEEQAQAILAELGIEPAREEVVAQ
jgi:putative transposase